MGIGPIVKEIITQHKNLGKIFADDAAALDQLLSGKAADKVWSVNPSFQSFIENYQGALLTAAKTIFSYPSPIKASDVSWWDDNRYTSIYPGNQTIAGINKSIGNPYSKGQEPKIQVTWNWMTKVLNNKTDNDVVVKIRSILSNAFPILSDADYNTLAHSLYMLGVAHVFVRTFPWMMMYFNVYIRSLTAAFASTRWKSLDTGPGGLNTNHWRLVVKATALEHFVMFLTTPEWFRMIQAFEGMEDEILKYLDDMGKQDWKTVPVTKIRMAHNSALGAGRSITRLIRMSKDFLMTTGQKDIQEVMKWMANYNLGEDLPIA